MEISDAQKERDAVAALRDAESRVNHSVCRIESHGIRKIVFLFFRN